MKSAKELRAIASDYDPAKHAQQLMERTVNQISQITEQAAKNGLRSAQFRNPCRCEHIRDDTANLFFRSLGQLLESNGFRVADKVEGFNVSPGDKIELRW